MNLTNTTGAVRRPKKSVFFTSDLHMFHDKVATLRGYPDAVAMHVHIVDAWSQAVAPGSKVWVLGDLTAGGHLEEALDVIGSLPGDKHLVLGNHDPAHPLNPESHKYVGRYLRVFDSVQLHAKRRIGGKYVMLSHFPYVGDSGPIDRHPQWRLPNLGRPLLHGHTHQGVPTMNHDGVVSVGWDAWYRPVDIDTIATYL